MALNRNALFVGGIRPHSFCLPILKREIHKQALVEAATSGSFKFFLGTDTAPHLKEDKESACGCAGIFNASYCLSILAQIFENNNALHNLEKFVSLNGAKHYNLKINQKKIKLIKSSKRLQIRKSLNVYGQEIKIFDPGFSVYWKVL